MFDKQVMHEIIPIHREKIEEISHNYYYTQPPPPYIHSLGEGLNASPPGGWFLGETSPRNHPGGVSRGTQKRFHPGNGLKKIFPFRARPTRLAPPPGSGLKKKPVLDTQADLCFPLKFSFLSLCILMITYQIQESEVKELARKRM